MAAAAPPAAPPAAPTAAPARAGARAMARLVAFSALAVLGLLTWEQLVTPAPRAGAVIAALAACGCGAMLIAAGGLERRVARDSLLAAAALVLAAVTLRGAGIPAALLAPGRWGDLASGLTGGIAALPGTVVPYDGGDEWVRRTLLLGGSALVAIAVLQAFWPRERGRVPGSAATAAISLGTLYAVPVISAPPDRPFLSGALFTLVFCAFLVADRVRGPAVVPSVLLVSLATLVAAALAPALDSARPWVDYQDIAENVANRGTVGYRWDHQYGPITWPRSGRELLRIKAQSQSYWKAEVLDSFDGRAWRRGDSVAALEPDGEQDRSQPQWQQTIHVTVAGLRSEQFVTAGSANRVFNAPRVPINAGSGTFVAQRGVLGRGARYSARVYTPRPTNAQLSNAGTLYPSLARQWLRLALPEPGAAAPRRADAPPWAEVSFPPFDSGEAALLTRTGSALATADGAEVVRSTGLARVYALAQRLRARAATPYDYVRLVGDRVTKGAVYTERPGTFAEPLDAFLFDDRRGYCQHFSGAMALLLRMGGIPARVAVGFAPGELDRRTGEYVVRDLDAHSWVEAYFPRYGWITLDPTPSASPAREQLADQLAALGSPRSRGPGGDRPSDPGFGGGAASQAVSAGRSPWPLIAAGFLALAIAALVVRRVRRRPRPVPASADPAVAELERAFRRTGRELAPRVTLADLERRMAGNPAALGYLRTLSGRRYGHGAPAPTSRQRAGMRAELAAGLGRLGRLRAWWALPPRPHS